MNNGHVRRFSGGKPTGSHYELHMGLETSPNYGWTCQCFSMINMRLSINHGGNPKTLVYNGKSYQNGWFEGTPPIVFKETSISLYYNIIAIIDHYSLVSFHSTIMMLRTTICHNHCIILRTPVILGMNVDCGYHNHMRVTSVLVQ